MGEPRYVVYRVTLPSGHTVRARKPGPIGLFAQGAAAFPLLCEAVKVVSDEDDQGSSPIESVHTLCRAALLDDVPLDAMPWSDRLALASWATAEGVDGGVPDGERMWRQQDFLPLVRGQMAGFLDAVCHRYSVTPSAYLGLSEATFAVDLDCAIAFRGLKQSSSSGDDLVEAEDMFGGKHRIPRRMLPKSDIPSDATVTDADSIARKYEPVIRQYGILPLAAGGGGPAGDGSISTMRLQ